MITCLPRLLSILGLLLISFTARAESNLSIDWTNNMLRISGPNVPGGFVEIWYLEAFCRSGSTHQAWDKTTLPQKTELLSAEPGKLRLRTAVQPDVIVDHMITAGRDDVDFRVSARNEGKQFADVQWFQPCMRVDRFTGGNQSNYIDHSFIFTADGLRMLDKLPRAEEALYHGGQVYVPNGISLEDVNPRPISTVRPANSLIGCFSTDQRQLLAMAWDHTQELFQGVIVCLHNDPRIGGLNPGEKKELHGKVYLLPNNPDELLHRYDRDFPGHALKSTR